MPTTGLLLADDFLWTSRITATSQALGATIKIASTAHRLVEIARSECPRFVILDLGIPEARSAELVRRLLEACSPSPRIVAYGSHVDVATLKAARAAGCDPVLTRSQMAEGLEELLRDWAGITTSALPNSPPQ
jgi:DNA-binding NarL/FixJ family response regulator